MKKFSLIFLTLLFSFGLYTFTFADDVDKSAWISWSPHNYNTYDNPQIGGGTYGQYSPWYACYTDESSRGVVLKYIRTGNYSPLYYYISTSNTLTGYINYNNYGNNNHTVPTMTTYNLTQLTSGTSTIGGIINKFNITEPLYYISLDLSQYNPMVVDNYDVSFTSIDNLYSQMEDLDFQSGWQDPNALGGLPVLTYTANSSIIYRITYGFDKKGIITWDYQEKEPYKSNPFNYCVDFVVSGHLNSGWHLTDDLSMDDSHKIVLSNGGCNVASNKFDWIYQKTGLEFYKTYDSSVNKFPYHDNNAQGQAEGYRVYVRTRNTTTGEASAWKIFNYIGGIFSSAGYAQDDSDPENPVIKPLTPENEDNNDYTPHFDKNNNTDAESDPTGQNYDGGTNFDPTTLFNNLKSAVNSLQELPQLFAQVVTFVPEWLVSLIFISIGMLVVVGVIKIILN